MIDEKAVEVGQTLERYAMIQSSNKQRALVALTVAQEKLGFELLAECDDDDERNTVTASIELVRKAAREATTQLLKK